MTDGAEQLAPEHVTIVFAGLSHSWAEWIADQLTTAGAATTLVRWDPVHRDPDTSALTGFLAGPGRVLLVLDDWYLRFDSGRAGAWGEVLREVVPPHRERLGAVSVTTRPLPEAAAALAPVGLRGIGPEEARRRLFACLGIRATAQAVDLARSRRFPDDLPEVWNAPRRNRRFTGRERTLERLHDAFAAGAGETACVALHGPSGVGKTQVATEYAHRFAGEYDIVWCVSAAVRATAREQFAALAEKLGVTAGDERVGGLIDAVKETLRTTSLRWLVILDGAEDPEDLESLIPEGHGHVLITTHRTAWSRQGAELVELRQFDREESIAFACRRAARLTEDDADGLAEALQDLPLLLDQMAAWLDTNPAASVGGYVSSIRTGDPHDFGILPSQDYPRGFQVAWAITLNTLREDAPEVDELLKLLAYFSPDVVPVRLLQTARAGDLPPHLADLVAEPSSWNSALRKLSEATSMRLEYEPGPRGDVLTVGTIRMHRLFHRFVRSSMAPAARDRASSAACRVLVSADPRDPASPRNWARYAELIPHLELSGALDSADSDVRDLVLNCIEYLRMRGEYHDGWWLSRQAVDRWRKDSGAADRALLVAVHQQANMLRRLGRYAEAETVGRDILGRLTADPEARAIEVLRAKDGLGGTLMALAKYDEATALFEDAAAEAAARLGSSQVPRTLAIRSNLAVAIGLQGRYEASLELHRSILEARVGLLGGRNPLTLNSALHASWTLRLLGRYEEALAIQEHNCRLHRQVLDRNHTQTLLAEHNLALCLRRDGNLPFAHAMMRKVRDRLVKRRGAHHPETLMVSADYAMLLREDGQCAQAGELADSTAKLYEAQLGGHHPYAVGARANCALVLGDAGERGAALAVAEETRELMAEAAGEAHPWTLGCGLNTAVALRAAGDTRAAARVAEQVLDGARSALGEAHPLTANCEEVLHDEHAHPYWDFEPQPT
ncbi:FxSxx-COOH system tetratricopeptide repeat protein [Streptomyces pathocidini]|uniref:FxSxx-COOH system tetratricopeptide repeat protein n=1 Tax=Streptomyces pathocidini TaxID=1650571 RepID=A0ABW7UMJ8_9ACTN|nr:FxSxx-COOH system tetratricopeptide repeat protein [Streptomyces pathocidini]